MSKETDKERDAQWIEEIRSGRTERYRDLVQCYTPMVFHIVRRFVRNDEAQVEELAQEIFVQVWERLDTFDGRARFSTWLYTLASNRCRDWAKNIRRKNTRISEQEPDFLERHWQTDQTPDRVVEQAEQMEQLRDALKELGPELAEPLLMKLRDGYRYKEISEKLGVSESALKVRVHRARKELQEALSRWRE